MSDRKIIYADDAIDAITNYGKFLWDNFHETCNLSGMIDAIEGLPSAQTERNMGRWIWKGEEGDSRFMCSVCKSKEYVPTCNGVPNIWEFCPNCGARMEGETDE